MKRLSTLLIAALLTVTCVQAFSPQLDDVPVFDESGTEGVSKIQGSDLIHTYRLLNYLGIVTDDEKTIDPDKTAVRGAGAEIFSRVANSGEMPKAQYFTDVSESSKYAAAVAAAVECDVVTVGDGKTFAPEAKLTTADAVEMAVRAVKYHKLMTDNSYIVCAKRLGMLNGIDVSSEYITVGQLMLLAENALNTDALIIKGVKNGEYIEYVQESSSTYLYESRKIGVKSGIVTGVSGCFIYSDAHIENNQIEINREVLDSLIPVDRELSGLPVRAYVDINDGKKLLIDVKIDKRKYDVCEIDGDSITEVESGCVRYHETDSRKDKSVDISAEAVVLFNGARAGKMQQALPLFDGCGNVIFIDNNGDKIYDIIKIIKYRYVVVKNISSYNGAISLMYDEGIIFVDDADFISIEFNGQQIEYNELKQWDVLSILESTNGSGKKCYSIVVSRETVKGVLESTEKTDDICYTVDGTRYSLTDEYINYLNVNTDENKPVLGSDGVFFTSHDGKIAASKVSGSFDFGFLAKAALSESTIDPEPSVRIYTLSGKFEVFEFSDMLTFYDGTGSDGFLINKSNVISKLTTGSEAVTNSGIIAYTLSSDGKIEKLALPMNGVGIAPGESTYPLILYSSTDAGRVYRAVFNATYNLSDAPIITYPNDTALLQDETAYNIISGNSYGTEKVFSDQKLEIFNLDKYYVPKLSALSGTTKKSVDSESGAFVINSVSKGIDADGVEKVQITYYDRQTLTKRFLSDKVSIDKASNSEGVEGTFIGTPSNASAIKPGDIVQIRISEKKEVDGIRFLFKIDSRPQRYGVQLAGKTNTIENNVGTTVSPIVVIYGIAEGVSGNYIRYNTSDTGDKLLYSYGNILGHSAYGKVGYYLFNERKQTAVPITKDEIQEGDVVVMRRLYNHICDVIVYR